MAMKVQTVIVNNTKQDLVLRVGNNNCFAKVAKIVPGGEHKIEIDVNWTYQEFSLEPAWKYQNGHGVRSTIIVSSDDCCDNERIVVTLSTDGKLHVDKVARRQASDINCKAANHRPVLEEEASTSARSTYFTWLPAWPKFNWRFWSWKLH